MTGIEVAKLVKSTGGYHLFRPKDYVPNEYDVKPDFTGSKRGWVALDLFSASAIVAVYDALNEANRVKFVALPLVKMARVAFKLIK